MSVSVSIIPAEDRTSEDKNRLLLFSYPKAEIEELPSMIAAVTGALGLGSETNAFSNDVMRVDLTEPRQPHLTLVALPGLIHAENKQQSSEDVELVHSLVNSYMANARSIIPAVVSAKNDYAIQIVTNLAQKVDPKGFRTIGIITKPDALHAGSESEKAFLGLARNEDISFRLGWHVLTNRGRVDTNCSTEERHAKEQGFFLQGVWATLPKNWVGIGSLKSRPSGILRNQIIRELPSLIRDIPKGIEECQSASNSCILH